MSLSGLPRRELLGTMARWGSAKTSPLRPQHWGPAAQTKVSTLKKRTRACHVGAATHNIAIAAGRRWHAPVTEYLILGQCHSGTFAGLAPDYAYHAIALSSTPVLLPRPEHLALG